MNSVTLHAEAPVLYRGITLTPDEVAIYLAAIEETQALWLSQPRNRPLFAMNLGYYQAKLAAHFEAVAEGGAR